MKLREIFFKYKKYNTYILWLVYLSLFRKLIVLIIIYSSLFDYQYLSNPNFFFTDYVIEFMQNG
jgi:hypothetical protein